MFATSRTVNVKGRIMIEIVSISTSNGDSAKGAPEGERWAVISTGIILTWATSKDNQKISPKVAANQIVEVSGKEKGTIPIRFKIITDTNTLRNHALLSLIEPLFIIWDNFLTIGRATPLEGTKSTARGVIHIIDEPWSTLEKISANIRFSVFLIPSKIMAEGQGPVSATKMRR